MKQRTKRLVWQEERHDHLGQILVSGHVNECYHLVAWNDNFDVGEEGQRVGKRVDIEKNVY